MGLCGEFEPRVFSRHVAAECESYSVAEYGVVWELFLADGGPDDEFDGYEGE